VRTLGTAVFAGMIGVTLFGLLLTPVFYYVVRGLVAAVCKPAVVAAEWAVLGTRSGHTRFLSAA
jgi:multidrug efflux pump